jgi:hypothetical protein
MEGGMEMSSLAYIPDFSVNFFFQPIYTDYANWAYFDKRSHLKSCSLKPLNQVKPNLHLWRAGMSDTILKETNPRTIPARFGLIWFRGFREDLNVKVYDVRRRMPSDGKS